MPVTLDEQERLALLRALDNYLPELRYEVVRSDVHSTQHELAQLEAILLRVRDKLLSGAAEQTAPTP